MFRSVGPRGLCGAWDALVAGRCRVGFGATRVPSPPPPPITAPLRQSPQLDKQGEPKRIMGVVAGKPGWKRRWVHIGKMKLTYHASEEDAESRARPIKNNYVQLTGYAVVPIDDAADCGPGCFELLPTLPHLDRVWVFKAPGGPPEREVWIRAFERGGCLRASDSRSAEAIAKRAAERAKA